MLVWATVTDCGVTNSEAATTATTTEEQALPTDRLPCGAMDESTTSNYMNFGDGVGQLAVRGLHGCSAVIVLSKRGVFAAHIYESHVDPSSTSHGEFGQRAITDIHRGRGDEFLPLGVDELTNNPVAGRAGTIFGGHGARRGYLDIQVLVVTPRPRVAQLYTGQDGASAMTPGRGPHG